MANRKNKNPLPVKIKRKNMDSDDSENDDIFTHKKRYTRKKIIDSESSSSESDESIHSSESDSGSESDPSTESSTEQSENDMPKNDTPEKKPVDILKKKAVKNSNEIFKELIKSQLSDIPAQWKLNINDMKRICKYIDTSIFDKHECCLWNGYITNINNSNKGTYVNFYFRNKKVALHRLLYSNFVAPLDSSEYLKFNCDNKGVCCNVYHYEKYKYSKNNCVLKKEQKNKEPKKDIKDITIVGSNDIDKLIIDFD